MNVSHYTDHARAKIRNMPWVCIRAMQMFCGGFTGVPQRMARAQEWRMAVR